MHLIQDEDTDEETLWISGKCTEEEANYLVEGSSIDIKIATTFGQIEVSVTLALNSERASSDIMRELVANIVRKSLLRCTTFSTMSTGETEEGDSLQGMLLALMSCLNLEDKVEELCRLCRKGSSPFESKTTIYQLINDILGSLNSQIIQGATAPAPSPAAAPTKVVRRDRSLFKSKHWTDFLPWNIGESIANDLSKAVKIGTTLAHHVILFAMSESLERDYFTSLRHICDKVKRVTDKGDRSMDILHLEAELKHLEADENREIEEAEIKQDKSRNTSMTFFAKASIKKEVRRKRYNKKVFLVEQMLIQLIGRIGGDLEDASFRRKLESVLSTCTQIGLQQAVLCGICGASECRKVNPFEQTL